MKRIFLIGFMGAGKTTLGKVLAKRLEIDFIDLDQYIEGRFRKSVREIFAKEGEEKFRQMEKNLLHEVSDFEDVIIATGGGTPCFFDNMDYMNAHGVCIYLQASTDELYKRLVNGRSSRPILSGKNDKELYSFIEETVAFREPFYAQAGLKFDTGSLESRREIDNAVERLQQLLQKKGCIA
ncbi:MAG: shikimate kinase [Porphyromonadaceae bacterium]|nr:shikimate kinase [Porphyromonadaceae bacterium]